MILPSFHRMPNTLRMDKERGYNGTYRAFVMAAIFAAKVMDIGRNPGPPAIMGPGLCGMEPFSNSMVPGLAR
jgi:hypothetical protein